MSGAIDSSCGSRRVIGNTALFVLMIFFSLTHYSSWSQIRAWRNCRNTERFECQRLQTFRATTTGNDLDATKSAAATPTDATSLHLKKTAVRGLLRGLGGSSPGARCPSVRDACAPPTNTAPFGPTPGIWTSAQASRLGGQQCEHAPSVAK